MALFGRRGQQPESDAGWLAAGNAKYQRTVTKHYGSPETLAAGGDQAMSRGDVAAAIFFYAKAIDTAQTRWGTEARPLNDDLRLFTAYLDALSVAHAAHPTADLVGDHFNNGGRYTANMMQNIAQKQFYAGAPSDLLDQQINRFLQITGMPIPNHW